MIWITSLSPKFITNLRSIVGSNVVKYTHYYMGWNRVLKHDFKIKFVWSVHCAIVISEFIITFLAIIVQNCVKKIVRGIFSPKFFILPFSLHPNRVIGWFPPFFPKCERKREKEREREKERGMDFGLAALKLVCAQLREAKETESQNSFTLGGILFQRAWLQVFHSTLLNIIFLFLLITPYPPTQHNQNKSN